jgi:hypothetical protein
MSCDNPTTCLPWLTGKSFVKGIVMTQLAPHVLASVLVATSRASQRLLVELAKAADEVSRAADRGGAWTDTPGTDALRALHPHLLPGLTGNAQDVDMAAAS